MHQPLGRGQADLGIREVDELLRAFLAALVYAVFLEQLVVQGALVLFQHAVHRLPQQGGVGLVLLVPPGADRHGDDERQADAYPLHESLQDASRSSAARIAGAWTDATMASSSRRRPR